MKHSSIFHENSLCLGQLEATLPQGVHAGQSYSNRGNHISVKDIAIETLVYTEQIRKAGEAVQRDKRGKKDAALGVEN